MRLAISEITRGCDPPANDRRTVTRGRFAAFLVRALGLSGNNHPGLMDVHPSSTSAEEIGKLSLAGITRGCNPPANDRFCPIIL
jgi:hypothetical protein